MTFLKGHQKVQAKVCYFLFIQIIENMWLEMIVIGSRTVTATIRFGNRLSRLRNGSF